MRAGVSTLPPWMRSGLIICTCWHRDPAAGWADAPRGRDTIINDHCRALEDQSCYVLPLALHLWQQVDLEEFEEEKSEIPLTVSFGTDLQDL